MSLPIAATRTAAAAVTLSVNTNPYLWTAPFGGSWNTLSDWTDIVTGTNATALPTLGNAVAIAGGPKGSFNNIAGAGIAAQMAVTGDVLLWGTIAVAGSLALGPSADLDLDGQARLTAGSLALSNAASLQIGNASTLAVTGAATLANSTLIARDGSIVQLGALVANGTDYGFGPTGGTIAVDDSASIEIGTAGNAAIGAITIDSGQTVAVSGTLDGNIVLNGVLGVQAYASLSIDLNDPFGDPQSIAGTGTLLLSQNSLLNLGIAESVAIRFGGPNGTLAARVLPTGLISGFVAGDVITLGDGGRALATGLRYSQVNSGLAVLTLTRGLTTVGTLSLAGNYTGSLFHLSLAADGTSQITLQTIGTPPVQPTLIMGTAGTDTLNATANGQTLTGQGGGDILNAGTYTGIVFKDTTAFFNGDTVLAFGSTSTIDLTDLRFSTIAGGFTATALGVGTLNVSDGTHSAAIRLNLATPVPVGYFYVATDGANGTLVRFSAVNTDPYLFTAARGSFATAANWLNTATATQSTTAPGYGNGISIAGGTAFTNLTGTAVAASLATTGNVLQWGTLTLGSVVTGASGSLTQSGTMAFDGAASLALNGTVTIGGLLEIGGGSTLAATKSGLNFANDGATLLAVGGSTARFTTGIIGTPNRAVIGVDRSSIIEFGPAGTAAAGALTIDSGMTTAISGTIDGNLIVNGILNVTGSLTVAPFGATAPTIGGTGTLVLTWGDTLSLAGPDSAAILFSQTDDSGALTKVETLALGTAFPTGTITGFAPGDVIAVAATVTGLSYTQTGSQSGTLTLLSGTSVIGTLLLAGTYVAGQFQVLPSGGSASSMIICAALPATATGSSVNGNADVYAWTAGSGGSWTNAANWVDTTASIVPVAAPGPADPVTIGNNPGAMTSQVITGSGSAASLTVTGAANTILTGTIAVGGAFAVTTFGSNTDGVILAAGASLTAASLNVAAPLLVSGNSTLVIGGTGTSTTISGSLTATTGGTARILGGTSVISGMLAADTTGLIEFGGAAGAAGTITIDSGQNPTLQGSAVIAGRLVVNGNMTVYTGLIEGFGGTTGAITGTGTITIGALGGNGTLVLNASDTATIAFKPYTLNGVPTAYESLQILGPLPTGAISGFTAGDTIVIGSTVTGVSYVQTTPTLGTLTLLNGAATVGTLSFNGSYTNSLFHVDVAAATGFGTITMQAATSSAGTAAFNTGRDTYTWIGAAGGSWAFAGNWRDATLGVTATTVPGSANPVSINGTTAANIYTTIGGNGSASTMNVTGNVLLTGQIVTAAVVRVLTTGASASSLSLDAGSKLTSAGSLSITGRFQAEGGSAATATGYAVLTGGTMLALSGSTVQLGGLVGNGSGNLIAVDSNSVIKIGKPTTAATGAVTQGAGIISVINGSIFGNVVVNGTLGPTGGGALWIDMTGTVATDPYGTAPTITGPGTLYLTENSTLGLGAVSATTIQFGGPNATLVLARLPTATITGFVAGDTIQLDMPVSGLTFSQPSVNAAILTLTSGASTVGTLNLAGSFNTGQTAFHLDVAPNGNTAVISLQSLLLAPTQPTLITGTLGLDQLVATAANQTLTGLGGGDILSAHALSSVVFKDLTANFAGCSVQDFTTTDLVDFTDMKLSTTTLSYINGTLSVTDGTHAAAFGVSFATTPASGAFHAISDGSTGTKLTWF